MRGLSPAMRCLLAASLSAVLVAPSVPAAAAPRPVHERRRAAALKRCSYVAARCGHLRVPLDRTDESLGTMKIDFELHRRRDRTRPSLGTIVAVEGGPGYSTTASRSYFLELFRPLLKRRRLLLVDNRGTGRSDPIRCKQLQAYRGDYIKAVGRCGRQLGERSDLYGSAIAADDLAAVLDHLGIGRIDLYGDSYGTFFSQTFAVRHPQRLRSLVLDAAYFVGGTDPFYIDTNRALRDAFSHSCSRTPTCARRKRGTMAMIGAMAERLRDGPIVGRAPNADGVMATTRIDVGGLIYLVTAAATSPTLYRELDAALRAGLRARPYDLPLLRLARETFYEGGAGPVRQYSEGLYVAVACNDYPQAFDIHSPIDERPEQYRRSIEALEEDAPASFAPFTVEEWITSPVEYFDSCLEWPVPGAHVPPVPPDAVYPEVPTLVLAGDLDPLTSPEGAQTTAAALPNSTYVEVANMTHVAALVDFDRCASRIVRRFVRELDAGDTSCAGAYNEIRLVDRFARRAEGLGWSGPRRRTARIAAETAGDVIARWLSMFSYEGRGLRGGTFTTTDGPLVRWTLDEVRWVRDVSVSGSIRWDRRTGEVVASLSVDGSGATPGRVAVRWNDWEPLAGAVATGVLAGRSVGFSFPAP